MHRTAAKLLLSICVVAACGCNNRSINPPKNEQKKTAAPAATSKNKQPLSSTAPVETRRRPAPPTSSGQEPSHDEAWAVDRVVAEIEASAADRPTLALWLIDASVSASGLREQVASRLSWTYADMVRTLPPGKDKKPALLSTAIAFGKEVQPLLEEPTAKADELIASIRGAAEDRSGVEMIFTAIEQALEKYAGVATPDRRQVVLVIATNEAGNDDQKLDQLLPIVRKQAIPVYVIGIASPFGRDAGIPQFIEASLDAEGKPIAADGPNIRQGPESRQWERIDLASSALISDSDLSDSGFGPFGLSWLAKDSGGSFLIVRQPQSELFGSSTSEASKFDPSVMDRYRPDYVSADQYAKLLASNGAMAALNRAAQLPHTEILDVAQTEFRKQDEAQLARILTEAQTAAARVEQGINALYQILSQGEKDRPRVTTPRWQAGYDLAMGRVLAAKARTEGYNVMLANLKQGRTFTDPKSNTWVLQPAVSVEGNSALERMAKQSREYLERVAKEHAGTPWAVVAERELEIQVGWNWSER